MHLLWKIYFHEKKINTIFSILYGLLELLDDFEKAQKKCRRAEDTSNLETEDDELEISKSKRRIKAKRLISMSDDESDGNASQNLQKAIKVAIERPPRVFVEGTCSIYLMNWNTYVHIMEEYLQQKDSKVFLKYSIKCNSEISK